MGAGCYYTLNDDRNIRAYWIDIADPTDDEDVDDDCGFLQSMVREDIIDHLSQLPLAYMNGNTLYYGKHYKIELESTYYGEGIVIQLTVDLPEYDALYPLMASNLERVYYKIIKALNKSFSMRQATSGYTSALYPVGSLN